MYCCTTATRRQATPPRDLHEVIGDAFKALFEKPANNIATTVTKPVDAIKGTIEKIVPKKEEQPPRRGHRGADCVRMTSTRREERAAIKLQAASRGRAVRSDMVGQQRAAIKMQAAARGRDARRPGHLVI